MELRDLLGYGEIVIQLHNVPDADALASGFAVYKYLLDKGKKARIIYGGREKIGKPNLLLMMEKLSIPVSYGLEEEPDLLISVDCQVGQSNVESFPAKNIAVIDHHEVLDREKLPPLSEVMESYGSCATVVYEMLKREGYPVEKDKDLSTALYYGLFTDTGFFQELWHPADRDMWEELEPDRVLIDLLKNTNLTSQDLQEIGSSFAGHEIYPEYRYGLAEVRTSDPNVLGIVSDTFLEVDAIDTCVVYAFLSRGVKLSVRSCVKNIRADELARYLTGGNGGGGIRKAGGFVSKESFCVGENLFSEERIPGEGGSFREAWGFYLRRRMQRYFQETALVHAGDPLDMEGFSLYRKLPMRLGVVDLAAMAGVGTKVKIRTLEGDIDVKVEKDQLLMIGVNEEIYPIRIETFEKNYIRTGKPYVFQGEYAPKVRSYETGSKLSLTKDAKECMALGTSLVYAKQLSQRVHVFTIWDQEKYITGEAGDWMAVSADHPSDVYIIASRVFDATYEKV